MSHSLMLSCLDPNCFVCVYFVGNMNIEVDHFDLIDADVKSLHFMLISYMFGIDLVV